MIRKRTENDMRPYPLGLNVNFNNLSKTKIPNIVLKLKHQREYHHLMQSLEPSYTKNRKSINNRSPTAVTSLLIKRNCSEKRAKIYIDIKKI